MTDLVRWRGILRHPPIRTTGPIVTTALAALALGLAGAAGAAPAAAAAVPKLPAHQLFVVSDPAIDEASGMVASRLHPGVVYLVNDSWNPPEIYAVGPDGRTEATLRLDGAANVDWEAMAPGVDAQGQPTLLVGDIGDNNAQRRFIRIYEIAEPDTLTDGPARWRKFDLRYPDGPHNAEGLMTDPRTGQVYVVTKEALGAATYAVPRNAAPGTTSVLKRVGGAPLFVTDAAISPDGTRTVLRTYGSVVVVDGPGGQPLATYRLPLLPQGETLAFSADGESLLIGSEGLDQPVLEVRLPADVPAQSPSASAAGSAGDADVSSQQAGGTRGFVLAAGVAGVVMLGLVLALVTNRRQRGGPTARGGGQGTDPQADQESRSTT